MTCTLPAPTPKEGLPSFGVGAGNVQVILDEHIDYNEAAETIIRGRIFDNGIICSG